MLTTIEHLKEVFCAVNKRILMGFLDSLSGNSSLANDLDAGHCCLGRDNQLGPVYHKESGPNIDNEVSDLVAMSAIFSFKGIFCIGITSACFLIESKV